MNKLFHVADEYISNCSWKDISLLKLCLLSMGILMGCMVPHKYKKAVNCGAFAIFITTYIPQMIKFLPVLLRGMKEEV